MFLNVCMQNVESYVKLSYPCVFGLNKNKTINIFMGLIAWPVPGTELECRATWWIRLNPFQLAKTRWKTVVFHVICYVRCGVKHRDFTWDEMGLSRLQSFSCFSINRDVRRGVVTTFSLGTQVTPPPPPMQWRAIKNPSFYRAVTTEAKIMFFLVKSPLRGGEGVRGCPLRKKKCNVFCPLSLEGGA